MKRIVYLIALVSVFYLASCKKDNKNTSVDYAFGVEVSSDYVSAQHLLFSLSNTYFKAIYDSNLFASGTATIDGAMINYYPDSTYQLHIFYPDWGQDDGYGNWRQGEIYAQADSGFFKQQFPVEISFVNFNLTKDTISADSYSYSYMGEENGMDKFNLKVVNGSRNFEDTTGVIYFNADLSINIVKNDTISGSSQPELLLFSGTMDGICRNGDDFSTGSTTDFMSDLSCNWMKSGVVTINFSQVEYSGTIYFSDTSVCENWYNLVIDNIDFPSKIQKPKWVK
ncbi:MAG: hypothetical protein GXO88_00755 [Chlorobi bacterium]|nr:hypothetical protein [Chlorobiota bacterium]